MPGFESPDSPALTDRLFEKLKELHFPFGLQMEGDLVAKLVVATCFWVLFNEEVFHAGLVRSPAWKMQYS